MNKIVYYLLSLLAVFASCNESTTKSGNEHLKGINKEITFFQVKSLADSLIYTDNQFIELYFFMNDSGQIVFNKKGVSKRVLSNDDRNSKHSKAELRYELKEINDSSAILSVSVFEKNNSDQFTVSKMNLGSTVLTYADKLELKQKVYNYLALTTYKYSPDR